MTNTQTTIDDVTREIDKGVSAADVQRGDELEQLQTVRLAKATGLQREHDRLASKLGDNHPRVAELADKIETNRGLLRDLAVETVRARSQTPSVDPKAWILNGYVRDQNLKGVAGLTVALYDEKAVWVEPLGFACTNGNGYFLLNATDIAGIDRPVFVRVLSNGTFLYADKSELKPELGRLDSREITLTGEARVCTPPEEPSTPPSKPPDTPPAKTPDTPPAKTPDTPPAGDPGASPDAWVVRGRATDQSGAGLVGLTVSVFDKDLIFDDRLGDTKTGADGNFSVTYRTDDFRDLIERKPDIYVKVLDPKGKTLYTSKGAVRYEAGRVETFEIKIPAGKLNR